LWEHAYRIHNETFSNISDVCQFLKLAGECTAGPRPARIRRFISSVQCFQKHESHHEAATFLKQVGLHFPNDTDAALQAGNMLAEMAAAGRATWPEAAAAFAAMHAWWGGSAHSLRSAALVHTQLGALEESLLLFDRALALQPDDEYAHSQALVASNQLGRYDSALRHAEAALRLSPSSGEHRLSVAQAQVKLGRYTAALGALRAARRLLPRSAAAAVETGLAHMGAGDMAAAARWLRKGIRLGARDFKLWLLVAAALTRAGGDGGGAAVARAYEAAVRACRNETRALPPARADAVCLLAEGRLYESLQRDCNWTFWDRCAPGGPAARAAGRGPADRGPAG
jgi:tetratricopeptide (TPR) repeat protein